MIIPRRFAIATKEVTVEQFQRFLKRTGITIDRYLLPPSFARQVQPRPGRARGSAPDWYIGGPLLQLAERAGGFAAETSGATCRPTRRGLRRGDDDPRRRAASGPAIGCPPRRNGNTPAGRVRSPAGITASRSTCSTLYARYQANSKEHAWPCGSLLPNDLGLFDMLGNVFEWCQDSIEGFTGQARDGIYNDNINISESIIEKNPRLLRGGSFIYPPAFVRSANRNRNAPAYRSTDDGFRPSRTYH